MSRRALVALGSLLAALLFAACDDAPDAPLDGVDPALLLIAAVERTEQVTSFHFALEHEGGTTEIVRGVRMKTAEGDVVGTDRLQASIEGSVGPLNLKYEIVILPDESWITNPLTQRWEREEISVEDLFDPAVGVIALMRAVSEPQLTDSDIIDGVEVYHVATSVDSGNVQMFGSANAGRELVARAWIGVDDPLVYRIELEGPLNAGEPDGLIRRITFSAFDVAVEIVAPR